jgi:hypothetical protein
MNNIPTNQVLIILGIHGGTMLREGTSTATCLPSCAAEVTEFGPASA